MRERGNEPAEQRRRGNRARELRDDEARRVNDELPRKRYLQAFGPFAFKSREMSFFKTLCFEKVATSVLRWRAQSAFGCSASW